MGWYGFGVHGNAFVPERMAGDLGDPGEPLLSVAGVPKSDYVGLRQGWGVTFRGKANHGDWFHVPIPTLGLVDHGATTLGEIQLSFRTFDTATVDQIDVWDGSDRVTLPDGSPAMFHVNLTGDNIASAWAQVFYPELSLRHGALGISVHVAFGSSDSNVLFARAYARFVSP